MQIGLARIFAPLVGINDYLFITLLNIVTLVFLSSITGILNPSLIKDRKTRNLIITFCCTTSIFLYEVARSRWMRSISGQAPSPRLLKPKISSYLDKTLF